MTKIAAAHLLLEVKVNGIQQRVWQQVTYPVVRKEPTISVVPILELIDNNTQKQKSSDKQASLGEFIRWVTSRRGVAQPQGSLNTWSSGGVGKTRNETKQNETRTYVVLSYSLICACRAQSLGHGNIWSLGTILRMCLPRVCSYRELAGGIGWVYRGRGNPSFGEYHKCWHVWNTLYDGVLCKIWQDQDDVVMISSGSEPGSPQKKERVSIILLSSESELGTPEKPKLKRPRGRYIHRQC